MSELDRPDEPTSTQEHADSRLPPAVEPQHPAFADPIGLIVDQPVALDPIEPPTESQAEAAVDEVISDTAAMALVGAIDRNGSEPELEPDSVVAIDPVPLPPAPVEPPGVPTVLDAVRVLSEQVNGRLEVIQAMVERELRAEMTRERVVDRLHAELQEYKQDLLLKVMRPMFVDLIQLHDDIGKMEDTRQAPSGEAGGEVDPVRQHLESIRTGIEDILYRQGVEPFQQEQEAFDARRQRAVTTVPTEDPALNKTVAARLRKGFQTGDKVIRPEIVSVYTLKKS